MELWIHTLLHFYKGVYNSACKKNPLTFSYRWNHRVSQYHQGWWSSFAVLSLTLQLKRATRLEGGPTEGWRLMSLTPLMFAAMHPIWPVLWFWSALYHQWESQWVVLFANFDRLYNYYSYMLIHQHLYTSCFSLPTFLFHFSLLWITSHTLGAAFHYFVCLPALYST